MRAQNISTKSLYLLAASFFALTSCTSSEQALEQKKEAKQQAHQQKHSFFYQLIKRSLCVKQIISMPNIAIFLLFLLLSALGTPIAANAATGSMNVTSHDVAEEVCTSEDFRISGNFILNEDTTPTGTSGGPTEYCSRNTSYRPFVVLPMSRSTYAWLSYAIDENEYRVISKVESYYLTGWTEINKLLYFGLDIDVSRLEPGLHTLSIVFQDIFGVSCYHPIYHWGYLRSQPGEIIDEATITFRVLEEGGLCCGDARAELVEECGGEDNIALWDEETCSGECTQSCDIKINNFHGNSATINTGGGETLALSADITDSSGEEIEWEVKIAGKTYSGTGKDVSVAWNGKNAEDRFVKPGDYTATIVAHSVDDSSCSDSATLPIKVEQDKNCNLRITFGSTANIATGNLAHNQMLFNTNGTGLNPTIKLYYNSLDPYIGPLGQSWSHSYDMALTEQADGSILLRTGNGDRKYYKYLNNAYIAPPGDYTAITKQSDEYTITYKNGITYSFDMEGRLASIFDRNSNTMLFTYTNSLLTGITDSMGRVTNLVYDPTGKLFEITEPGGKVYEFMMEYDTLTGVTYPDGGLYSFTYDADNFLTSRTDPAGYTTTYTYDDQHRVKTATDPEGKSRSITYSTSNESLRTATITEKDGSIWQYTYDSEHGDMVEKVDPQGGVTSYVYDENHNLLSKIAPDGSVTSYDYDEQGNMVSSTDALGQVTNYTYNAFGQAVSITGPEGDTTSFTYDDHGNLISVIDPGGAKSIMTYDANGQLISVTDQLGRTTTLNYDEFGNLVSITDPTGAQTTLSYDQNGNIVGQTDALGNTTLFAYDATGNLIKITDPQGNVTLFSYDQNGNKSSQTDANGNTTYFEYNYQGQLLHIKDAIGNITSFSYGGNSGCSSCSVGSADKLTALTDASGRTTSFGYDSLGRLIGEADPLNNQTLYGYNGTGKLISSTNADGEVILYSYDALGRLVSITYPDGSISSFSYDGKGNLLTASNPHISYQMDYDSNNRLTSITDSNGRSISYTYDATGNPIRLTTPDNDVVTYGYDEAGRLKQIDSFAGSFIFDRDTLGRRSSLSYPNGVKTSYDYDAAGRLVEILGQDDNGKLISYFAYSHDKVGNRLSMTAEDMLHDYSYDKIYRLLETVPSDIKKKTITHDNKAEIFAYDPVGNRLEGPDAHDFYEHNDGNQVVADHKYAYQYDAQGNLTGKSAHDGTSS